MHDMAEAWWMRQLNHALLDGRKSLESGCCAAKDFDYQYTNNV